MQYIPQSIQAAFRANLVSSSVGAGAASLGVKQPGHEGAHIPQFSSELKE